MKKKSFKLFAFRLKYNFDVYLKTSFITKNHTKLFFFALAKKKLYYLQWGHIFS